MGEIGSGREQEDEGEKEHSRAALEATKGGRDGFVSQLPYKCYLEEVASVGD